MSCSHTSLHIKACTVSMPCVVVFLYPGWRCRAAGEGPAAAFIPQCHTATFTIEDLCTIYGCNMLLSVFYTLKLTSGLTFTSLVYSLCGKIILIKIH